MVPSPQPDMSVNGDISRRGPLPSKAPVFSRKLAHRRARENACSHTVSPNSPVNGPWFPLRIGVEVEGQWPLPEAHSGDGELEPDPLA